MTRMTVSADTVFALSQDEAQAVSLKPDAGDASIIAASVCQVVLELIY
jgi:hypothetical protein